MPVTVHLLSEPEEQIDLRNPAATVRYLCKRTDDEAEARVAINANSPAFYYGLPKLAIRMVGQGGGVWTADVEYGLLTAEGTVTQADQGGPAGSIPPPPPPPPPNPTEFEALDESFAFSITGMTEHVTQARRPETGDGQISPITAAERQVFRHDLTGPFLPSDGTLGWDESGKVAGVDRQYGYLEVSYTTNFPTVSFAYLKKLKRYAFCVNSGFYFRHKEGELLFLGATGGKTGPAGWPVTFRFGLCETETNIVIWEDPEDPTNVAKKLIVPRKRGWDYLWVEYETKVRNGRLVKVPKVAHVEQIFRYVSFDDLGIGRD